MNLCIYLNQFRIHSQLTIWPLLWFTNLLLHLGPGQCSLAQDNDCDCWEDGRWPPMSLNHTLSCNTILIRINCIADWFKHTKSGLYKIVWWLTILMRPWCPLSVLLLVCAWLVAKRLLSWELYICNGVNTGTRQDSRKCLLHLQIGVRPCPKTTGRS